MLTHSACFEHDTGPGHPESVERLRAVLAALQDDEFLTLVREEAPRAETEDLRLAHSARHLDLLRGLIPERGWSAVDADTILSAGSWDAALRAAGAVIRAVDQVVEGRAGNAFCAVRPPGHHAESGSAMGFCLFNNIAIGALHARHRHHLTRIAVVDFDVHHGNGTQEIFEGDGDLFFASTHQSGAYPGTGLASEHGVRGNIVNLPLPSGSGSAVWRRAMSDRLLPALSGFAPELILISAGFDAHRDDPLAQLSLTTEDFFWGTDQICRVAHQHCGGRVVSVLEGGYDLPALAASAQAHVRALMANVAGT